MKVGIVGHFRVAMLTDHMGVNVLWIDAAMSSDELEGKC